MEKKQVTTENDSGSFHRLIHFFHRPFVFYFLRSLICFLAPVLLMMNMVSRIVITNFEKNAHTRLFSAIENTMERIDTTFTTLSSTAMQAMNGRYFSTQYIARTPTVFTEIRSSLETINFSNSLLQGGNVSFYSPATPSTFYTEMGTYNEKYFRHYRTEDGKKLEAKEIFDTIDYCRFLPCYSLDQSVVFNNSLDIIYAQKGQTGAYLIFSIVEQPLKTLLSLDTYHPEQILVMDSAGRRLYPLNLEITQAQEKMESILKKQAFPQIERLDSQHEIISAQSAITGLKISYLISEEELLGDVRPMQLLLMGFLVLMFIFGCVIITVYSRSEAQRIDEVHFLSSRLYRSRQKPRADEAAFDRMRAVLSNIYLTNSNAENTSEEENDHKSPDEVLCSAKEKDDLLEEQTLDKEKTNEEENDLQADYSVAIEEMLIESAFIRRVIVYINEHQSDRELNVGKLADVFGVESSNLSHQFKNATGYAISDYINAKKLAVACDWLNTSRMTVSVISERLGYAHPSSFIRTLKKIYGTTPAQYRTARRGCLESDKEKAGQALNKEDFL